MVGLTYVLCLASPLVRMNAEKRLAKYENNPQKSQQDLQDVTMGILVFLTVFPACMTSLLVLVLLI